MPAPEISPELEDLIVRRLAETANRNKVIEELCLERGFHWQVADEIVEELIQTHQLDLTRRQSPFLVLLALSIFVGGVMLVAWNLLGIYHYLWPYLDPQTPDALGLYFLYSDTFQVFLNMSFVTPLFITGLALIVGSCLGMQEVWAACFEWFDQQRAFSFSALVSQSPRTERHPDNNSKAGLEYEALLEADSVPSREILDYVFDHLEQGRNQAEVVEALWFKFGMLQPEGERLVRQVRLASGEKFSEKHTAALVMAALAAFCAGLAWVFQFIFLLADYLAGIQRPLANSWDLILWLSEIARYIERFPGLFAFFLLGLAFLGGGVYGLRGLWPLIYLLKRKPA